MLLFLYSERISMFQSVVFCQESVSIVPLGQGSFSLFTFYCPLDYDFCEAAATLAYLYNSSHSTVPGI